MTPPVPSRRTGAEVPVVWVDAFTDRAFGGNPAAVCLLDGPADDGWLQALAAELGLSETAYVWPEAGGLSLRWFTPATEVALCGHATVAAAHALRETGHWRRWDVTVDEEVTFRTRSGPLRARFDGALVALDLPAETPVACPVPDAVAAWAPLAAATAAPHPAEPGAAGPERAPTPPEDLPPGDRPDLVVELASPDAVQAIVPDLAALGRLPYRLVAATAAGDGSGSDYVLRAFAPAVGVDEDPVTGSVQCLLGPYWASRLGRRRLEARQGRRRQGRLRVTVGGDRVEVAGHAVTVLTGHVAAPAVPGGAGAATGRPELPTMGLPEP